jgi:toxin ParE1/3/4
MAGLRYSAPAARDLVGIAIYSQRHWGEAQAIRYVNALEDCCDRLAEHPELGRTCDEIRPGLRRIEEGRHVIFYRQKGTGIVVSRILHKSMLPQGRL